MGFRIQLLALVAYFVSVSIAKAQDEWLFSSPAGDRFATIVPGGETVLPNGRSLTPKGLRLYAGENLWNTIPSPDGKYLVVCAIPGSSSAEPRTWIRGHRRIFCLGSLLRFVVSSPRIVANSSSQAETQDTESVLSPPLRGRRNLPVG